MPLSARRSIGKVTTSSRQRGWPATAEASSRANRARTASHCPAGSGPDGALTTADQVSRRVTTGERPPTSGRQPAGATHHRWRRAERQRHMAHIPFGESTSARPACSSRRRRAPTMVRSTASHSVSSVTGSTSRCPVLV